MMTVAVAESIPFGKTQRVWRHSTRAAVMTVTIAMSPTGAELVGPAAVGMMPVEMSTIPVLVLQDMAVSPGATVSNVIAWENGLRMATVAAVTVF